jgi:hypothetical protein
VDGLAGTVVRGSFGKGSKSEREAIWLEADGRGQASTIARSKNM